MALRSLNYDVFLSFRGEDTRHGFTGHLYRALRDKGINTFIDDEKLPRGEEITPALMKAIEESRIAITVISKNYAFSSFCLDELAHIIHCSQKKGWLVIPVFYKIDPSEVRQLKGTIGKGLAKNKKRFPEKLQKWEMALHEVASLSGYHFQDGDEYEYKFIEKILEQVSRVINRVPLLVAAYPIGLEPQVLKVRELLDVRSDDGVCMIGIHGMGGVGKSTLARAVYNDFIISENFDGWCFLANVREDSNKYGLQHLQRILLSKILGEKDINLTCSAEGASMIQKRLQGKKVLLVLDDVDKLKQLQTIAGGCDWFGCNSIIIITTRDKQVLESHQVNKTYEVKELNENDALQLLTWKSFKKEKADPSYEEVLNRVINYASGLPLALELISSSLSGKSIEQWESAIDQYNGIPKNEIQQILKVSFDVLEKGEQSVFLDLACCFKGCLLTDVEDILSAHYGHSVKHLIEVLVEKSLIKHSEHEVTLHDLIEDMGKEIVLQESLKHPEKRSRLWSQEDIKKVLEDNMGTREIEMICLDFPLFVEEIEWDGNAFKEMTNLKTLVIRNGEFSKGPNYFPTSLRVLEWHRYPSSCFPSNFDPYKLFICKLPGSSFTSFEFHGSSKVRNLTVLNFDGCEFLTQIHDVTDLPNLQEFSFKGCVNLTTVHDSVGLSAKLKILRAEDCIKLRSFPPLNLISLKELELSGCSSLEYFPEILGEMDNITNLSLSRLPIKELPVSFQNLIGLKSLGLSDCGIVHIQSSIALMPEVYFAIQNCNKWQVFSEEDEEVSSIVSSQVAYFRAGSCNLDDDFFSTGFNLFAHADWLDLSGNNFTFLPECFKELQFLTVLDVSHCEHLQEIRGVPPNLKRLYVSGCKHLQEIREVPLSLEDFYATDCRSLTRSSRSMFLNKELHEAGNTKKFIFPGTSIPEWFDCQNRGPSSCFWFRNKFPAKVFCLLIAPVWDLHYYFVIPTVLINGKIQKPHHKATEFALELDHTHLFDLEEAWKINFSEVAWENEWNHVEIRYEGSETAITKATGIHILFKQENNNMDEDIRFDNPYINTKLDDDHLNSSRSQNHSLLESMGLGTHKFSLRFYLFFFMFFLFILVLVVKKMLKNPN